MQVEIYLMVGQQRAVAQVHSNQGLLLARKGDIPAALDAFEWADRYFVHSDSALARGFMLLDRCQALLSVRLAAEARRDAEDAIVQFANSKANRYLAEARLLLSHATLLEGDVVTARSSAEEAQRSFARQGLSSWAALARHTSLGARMGAGGPQPNVGEIRPKNRG